MAILKVGVNWKGIGQVKAPRGNFPVVPQFQFWLTGFQLWETGNWFSQGIRGTKRDLNFRGKLFSPGRGNLPKGKVIFKFSPGNLNFPKGLEFTRVGGKPGHWGNPNLGTQGFSSFGEKNPFQQLKLFPLWAFLKKRDWFLKPGKNGIISRVNYFSNHLFFLTGYCIFYSAINGPR